MSEPVALSADRPLTIAILAIGGQGGGVLSNWLLQLAESNGWRAQSTSVPGVAQRTGATVYYLELLPEGSVEPVLALMPEPRAVDLVVAAELAEAARAVQRGFVSPERTLLLASSHRAYAVSEKSAAGDGVADNEALFAATKLAAKTFLHADMAALAAAAGSAISASLFGGIAASGALPFDRAAFEATIVSGGVGVKASLAAFELGFTAIKTGPNAQPAIAAPRDPALNGGNPSERERYAAACERIARDFPQPCHTLLVAGLNAVVDFQDARYGDEYLDRLQVIASADQATGGATQPFELTTQAAKYLARAMAYDDVIRVADLKTRASRFSRVRVEVGAPAEHLVRVTEYMHPRVEEVCAMLPAGVGARVERWAGSSRWVRRVIDRGRRVHSDSLRWFLVLYCVSGLRRMRRGNLRHARENAVIDRWLALLTTHAADDYPLAVEIARCRRLIKGYSDTHARGTSRYQRVLAALPVVQKAADPAAQLSALCTSALADEDGTSLTQALAALEHATTSGLLSEPA